MNQQNIVITSIAIILFLYVTSHAQDARPKVPFVQHAVCPFECCQFGKWTAKSPLKAYKKEGDNTAIAFMIKPGEEFIAIDGNVHIMKLGEIILDKSFDNFIKNDKIYILSYRGEGFYDLWYKGKVIDGDSDGQNNVWANSKLVNSPEFVWWVLVKNRDGKQGWLRLKNISNSGFRIKEKIDGMDSCS